MRDRWGRNGRGSRKELGEVEGRETKIRIYCMKKSLFSNKEKTIKKLYILNLISES